MIKLLCLFIVFCFGLLGLKYFKRPNQALKKTLLKKKSRRFDVPIPQIKTSAPLLNTKGEALPLNSLTSPPPKILAELELIKTGMIDEETYAYATQIIDSIKRPHPALQSLTKDITAEELIDIMYGSPDITAKILSAVNSSSFGLLAPITSINHAIIYLDIDIVKSIALQLIIKDSFNKNNIMQEAAYKKLWIASNINSSLSFLMSQSLSKISASELSTKTLLHNVGNFALLSYDPTFAELYENESSLLNRTLIEQKTYGLNASIIGSLLAKKWKLPPQMFETINHSLLTLKYKNNTYKLSDKEKQNSVFCYLMCRIGDEVVYGELRDLNNFNLDKLKNLDCFYLKEALQDTQLFPCLEMLKNPQFIKKANQIIQQAL